jgi:NAD(P) transhydrogenase subunit alpha
MRLGIWSETTAGEKRVALVPETAKKLVKAGVEVLVQKGAGAASFFEDHQYEEAGAKLVDGLQALASEAEFIFAVQPPSAEQVVQMKEGSILLASLLPMKNHDVVKQLKDRKITAFSTDAIPRTTRAQSMDTLSSMANIAGYKAAIIAADHSAKYFPMFMTAAGTVFAAKVFIIGAGVAGLQAIATARRLGATVLATDTRSVVKEQIESLGGKFVGVDSAEDAQTASGYAKELSADFYTKQAELIKQQCAQCDAVITTALIGGIKAPTLITAEMVRGMSPGSVIVDLAAEAGGNCELTKPGEDVVEHGVTICGPLNLPSQMPYHASTLYSRNLVTFLLEFWKDNQFQLDREDEIIAGALITHGGEIVNERVKQAIEGAEA